MDDCGLCYACPGSHITTQLCNNSTSVPTFLTGLLGGGPRVLIYINALVPCLTHGDSSHAHEKQTQEKGGKGKEGHSGGKPSPQMGRLGVE